jgi:hypothetical protein
MIAQVVLGEMINAQLHSCSVCGQKVLHDTFELAAHFVMKHDMTVVDYAQKHLDKSSVSVLSVSPPSIEECHSFNGIKSEQGTSYLANIKSTHVEESLEGQMSRDTFYEQKVMMCKCCQKTFKIFDTALEHLMKEKDGKCIFLQKVYYQCKICHSSILCRRDIICHHLTDKHGLTIEKYGLIYESQKMKTESDTNGAEKNSKAKKDSVEVNEKVKPNA